MARSPATVPGPDLVDIEVLASAARLSLAPSTATPSHVDGTWWPRSTELTAELPALLEAVHDRTGPVALVGFHRGAWHCQASELILAGQSIWLEGFTDEEPHTVIVIGSSGRRLTLTVLAPDTTQDVALTELAGASGAGHPSDLGSNAVGDDRWLAEVVDRLVSREDPIDERRTRTIESWVHEAATQFVHAPVQAYVPVLVEHIVRQQITQTRHYSLARS